jgi:maltose alpha-D-glucosyltransferase/alpha-amylase
MQWSYDRNAGFSRADTEQLYSPVIINPNFHFESINVESESRMPTSLLNWIKKMIRIRKKFSKVMGRGTIRFINTSNKKVLAFLREYEGEKLMCLFNISRTPTFLEMDLKEFRGLQPKEALTDTLFPAIGDLPYFFTFPPRSFYWMSLTERADE